MTYYQSLFTRNRMKLHTVSTRPSSQMPSGLKKESAVSSLSLLALNLEDACSFHSHSLSNMIVVKMVNELNEMRTRKYLVCCISVG